MNPTQTVTAIFQSWDQFTTGYEAGIADGIVIGRAQVKAEEWPIWEQFVREAHALGRKFGPLGHREHEAWIRARQEKACRHPGWTPEQIREHAARTWHLGTTPTTTNRQSVSNRGRWSA